MASVEVDISRHCQELDREDRETELDELRATAMDNILANAAELSADDWATMLHRALCSNEWPLDDDPFWRRLGERAKLAFETGMGI